MAIALSGFIGNSYMQSGKFEDYISMNSNHLQSDSPELAANPTIRLFDLEIKNERMEKAIEWVFQQREGFEYAAFVNAHSINLCHNSNSDLRQNLNSAGSLFADGSGMALAARIVGSRFVDNVNGTDMLPLLCQRAQREGKSIFLLGAAAGIAEKMKINLCEQYPGLQVVGTHHGFFNHEDEENDSVVAQINASGADILLVGFGSPLQERWLANNARHLTATVGLAVGGLFDFYSGQIPRAPYWMRQTGIEWIWRLMQEPQSKFSRYVIGNPLFIARSLNHRLQARQGAELSNGYYSRPGLSSYLQRLAAFCVIAILSPVFIAIGMTVKLTSKGPIFYHQVRVGKYGKRFKFYKFRSMYLSDDPKYREPNEDDSDRAGVCKKYKKDPRITPIGRFIRKYSIDELPQLWNVLAGDMVLVGPRPALVEEVEAYDHDMYRRFDVLPGLTGLWQVSGRADTSFEEQIALDLKYVDKRSWLSDLNILFRTVPAVLLARGAY